MKLFLRIAFSVHHCLFLSGLEQMNSSLFDVIRMCALCGGENKLQGLAVLLFLPLAPLMCGYVSILLCGQMRLRQSVSSCCVGINNSLSLFKFAKALRSRLTKHLHPASQWSLVDNHYNLTLLFCLLSRRVFLNFEVKALCPLFKFFTVLTLFLFFFCPFCPFLGKVCWIPSVC